MHSNQSPTGNRFSSFVIFLLVIAVFWLLYDRHEQQPIHDPDARPRVVSPRGDLAGDEQNTIDLFKKVSPSVVFINSIELRRGFFNLNVYEIPSGTGSGFIWDN